MPHDQLGMCTLHFSPYAFIFWLKSEIPDFQLTTAKAFISSLSIEVSREGGETTYVEILLVPKLDWPELSSYLCWVSMFLTLF